VAEAPAGATGPDAEAAGDELDEPDVLDDLLQAAARRKARANTTDFFIRPS